MSCNHGEMYFVVHRNELLAHFDERFDYHSKRNLEDVKKASEIGADLEEDIKEFGDDIEALMSFKTQNTYNDRTSQRDRLRASARNHAQKASYFNFYRMHLPADLNFELDHNQLISLEILR